MAWPKNFEDRIAETVLSQFDSLPAKCKPPTSGNSKGTWVPLSGIVISREEGDLKCVALGTGMRCLPGFKAQKAAGLVLHDWHAEIIAFRCFNRFLLQECRRLVQSPDDGSPFIRRKQQNEISKNHALQLFTMHDNLHIHLYCSEAPCGDASMELVMKKQADPTPWLVAEEPVSGTSQSSLKGRANFSELGIVRRKPSRSDSPTTLSKSCSDKLAIRQCTSLLSSLLSVLIAPDNVYLDTLILPSAQYSQEGIDRAFSVKGRMKPVVDAIWPLGYRFTAFKTRTTDREFSFSRRTIALTGISPKGSNISSAYHPGLQETLINGVLQGRKQTDLKGGSALCNVEMWKLVSEIVSELNLPALNEMQSFKTYQGFKDGGLLEDRREVKRIVRREALKGWIRNEGDDFPLQVG